MARSRLVELSAACLLAGTTGLAAGCAGRDASSSNAEDEATAEKYYNVALGSFHNAMFEDAKVQLSRALEQDPDHAESHYLLGVIHLHEGKEMIDSLEAQVCLQDEAAGAQRERADGLHHKAHESFSKAVESFGESEPGHGRALNSMSVVSLYFDDLDSAVTEAGEALHVQFYTERYSALSNLGWAYYQKGDLVQAMTELREALMLNPEYCVGRYRLAQIYLDADLTGPALDEIKQVVDDPRCPIQDAHRIAGVASMRMGEVGEAQREFRACVDMAPRSCLAAECERFSQVAAADAKNHSG